MPIALRALPLLIEDGATVIWARGSVRHPRHHQRPDRSRIGSVVETSAEASSPSRYSIGRTRKRLFANRWISRKSHERVPGHEHAVDDQTVSDTNRICEPRIVRVVVIRPALIQLLAIARNRSPLAKLIHYFRAREENPLTGPLEIVGRTESVIGLVSRRTAPDLLP